MDKIDVIIVIGLIVMSIFSSIRKIKKQNATPIPEVENEEEEPQTYYMEDENEKSLEEDNKYPKSSSLEEIIQNYPKSTPYFTYDDGNSLEKTNYEQMKEPIGKEKELKVNLTDNEKVSEIGITFSEEEIIKGIIYSEILKRPNY